MVYDWRCDVRFEFLECEEEKHNQLNTIYTNINGFLFYSLPSRRFLEILRVEEKFAAKV